MRILILGGNGMIGHQLFKHLQSKHEVRVTLRREEVEYSDISFLNNKNAYFNLDVRNFEKLEKVFADFRPEVVINAVGIIKQKGLAKEKLPCIELNALFPHKLANLCASFDSRLIHLSTDCVFSGHKGNYTENDLCDAEDIYGKTKYLGEITDDPNCITLRTSTIGLELGRSSAKHGLLEWFLAQQGEIHGYQQAIYTGLTTIEFARVVECVIMEHKKLSGLWHVASTKPVNKYELLLLLATKLNRKDISIVPDNDFICDRSLNTTAFKEATGYVSPSWDIMLDELAATINKRRG
jgi:dTDP-4-dehydrorhamnose reductase